MLSSLSASRRRTTIRVRRLRVLGKSLITILRFYLGALTSRFTSQYGGFLLGFDCRISPYTFLIILL
ncbi:hypothetical protein LINPERHAP1_LOCUS35066 [Linum perenne]